MIKRIILTNWKTHMSSDMSFSKGVNALLGHLGAGKTSVLDAICFALFGTYPSLQSKKIKLDDVIMAKPVVKNRAEVELFFEVDGKNYSVKRVIERGKGTVYSEIREEGKIVEAHSTQRVTEFVQRLLKVDYDLFSKVIYSEQNSLDYFLTLPRGQRMKKFDELLMIERFEKARANVVTLRHKLEERCATKRRMVEDRNLEELERKANEIEISIKTLSEERKKLEEEMREFVSHRKKLEEEFEKAKKVKEEYEELIRKKKEIEGKLEEARRSVENVESDVKEINVFSLETKFQKFQRFLKEYEEAIREKRRVYQKLKEKIAELKAETEMMRKERVERLRKEFEERKRIKEEFERYKKEIGRDIKKDKEKLQKELEKVLGDVEKFRSKIEDVEDTINKLSSSKSVCPVCESKLPATKKRKLLKNRKKLLKEIKRKLEEAEERRDELKGELEKLEMAAKKLEEMGRDLEDYEKVKKELEAAESMLAISLENLQKMMEEEPRLKKELEEMEENFKRRNEEKQRIELLLFKARQFLGAKRRMEELEMERKRVDGRISSLQPIIAQIDLESLEREFRELVARERELNAKIMGISSILEEREKRLEELRKEIEFLKKEFEEVKKLEKLIKDLKIFEKALKLTQEELRKDFVIAVNYHANNVWETLYPYRDFIGIRLAIEEGDYVLQLQERSGRWVNVEGIASGGERSIACLALRIALSLALAPQLRLLVLDEPTHNLDRKAVEDLARTLRERVGEFMDQVFLITHDEKLEEAVTGNVYRLERVKEEDGPTKVIRIF